MTTPTASARKLRELFLATLARLDPAALVVNHLGTTELPAEAIVVLAVGKAAHTMAAGAAAHLGDRVSRGLIVAPLSPAPLDPSLKTASEPPLMRAPWKALISSHPEPDERSASAAMALRDAMLAVPAKSHALVLISGGASALAALPAPGLTLANKVSALAEVANSGADVVSLNAVRKHLSAIKGGQLAAMCPVPVTTLVLSDVIGDDLSAVGSGPTLPDPTTFQQAYEIVEQTAGWSRIPPAVRDHLERGRRGEIPETPKRARPGDRAMLIAGIDSLVDAARRAAGSAGLITHVMARNLAGDVNEIAGLVTAHARRLEAVAPSTPRCLLAGGEPTIVLPRNPGTGGRAQHLAMLIARSIAGIRGVAVLVAGSDGIDGNSHAAGAIVDGQTWQAMIDAGARPQEALERCDTTPALERVGATLVTGRTGVNHADLIAVCSAPELDE